MLELISQGGMVGSQDDRPDRGDPGHSDPTHDDEQGVSLVRRTLHQDQRPRRPTGRLSRPDPAESTQERLSNRPLSPIRPSAPDSPRTQDPLPPNPPASSTSSRPLTPREQMQRAEEALISLREKMSQIAAEFADGKLNRDQFQAIYGRYSEQRDITERLLARNPDSQAWQSVINTGYTAFLIERYAARVLSYAVYEQATGTQIAVSGSVQIEASQARAVLDRLQTVMAQRGNPGPAQKPLADGTTVLIVPGELTAAIVIYSREPSAGQVARVLDLQADFERANARALHRRDYAHSRLVFPHRALFESPIG